MKHARWMLWLPLVSLGCGPNGSKTADVVQAATRGAAEIGQQLAEKAAEISGLTPQEAKAKVQEFLDYAARELRAVRDSETAQRIAAEVQRLLEQLGLFAARIKEKINVAGLQTSIEELITRFKSDPRVVSTLKSLQEKLNTIAR